MRLLSVTLVSLACHGPLAMSISQEQEDYALSLLETLWTEEDKSLVPTMVRFGFHACHEIGCNGCIELAVPPNHGLEGIHDKLNFLYDEVLKNHPLSEDEQVMSRADFWSLAAWNAVKLTVPEEEDLRTLAQSYKNVFGRQDCSTSPIWDSDTPGYQRIEFPSAIGLANDILRWFGPDSIYGFTHDEVVALVGGGHSLGKASLQNTGHEGTWDETPEVLDADFVQDLVHDQWSQYRTPAGAWQYYNDKYNRTTFPTVGFLPDASLLKDVTIDPNAGRNNRGKIDKTCSTFNGVNTNCPESIFAERTKYYAREGNQALVPDFLSVYYRLLTTVPEGISLSQSSGASNLGFGLLMTVWCVLIAY